MPILALDSNNRILTVDGEPKPHITDVLRDMGLSKFYEGVADIQYYAERGQAVHMACRIINEGILDEESVSEDCKGYIQAYRLFLKESGFIHEASEIPLYSGLHDFCGTLDLVGAIHGQRVVIDIKTSSSIDPSVEIQVGAQAILWNHNNQGKPLSGRYVLQLKKDSTYRLKDLSHINEFLFLDALKLWHWKQSHKRKVKHVDELRVA
jgi:hypothetical protein